MGKPWRTCGLLLDSISLLQFNKLLNGKSDNHISFPKLVHEKWRKMLYASAFMQYYWLTEYIWVSSPSSSCKKAWKMQLVEEILHTVSSQMQYCLYKNLPLETLQHNPRLFFFFTQHQHYAFILLVEACMLSCIPVCTQVQNNFLA
jgi:hypothetical protein